jgi:hypothetical protein
MSQTKDHLEQPLKVLGSKAARLTNWSVHNKAELMLMLAVPENLSEERMLSW